MCNLCHGVHNSTWSIMYVHDADNNVTLGKVLLLRRDGLHILITFI